MGSLYMLRFHLPLSLFRLSLLFACGLNGLCSRLPSHQLCCVFGSEGVHFARIPLLQHFTYLRGQPVCLEDFAFLNTLSLSSPHLHSLRVLSLSSRLSSRPSLWLLLSRGIPLEFRVFVRTWVQAVKAADLESDLDFFLYMEC